MQNEFSGGAGTSGQADQTLMTILDSVSDAFVALDRDWRYTYVNARAGQIFQRRPVDLIGKHIWTEFPEGVGQVFQLAYQRALAEQVFIQLEEYYPPYDRWFENRIYPRPDGLSIFFHDVTDRKLAETLAAGQSRVLEKIAIGEPLSHCLVALVECIEHQSPSMLGSILTLDADGVRLRHAAAPSLPLAYSKAVDGQPAGASAGSCGTAVFRREAVIVEDIATDPLWQDYKEIALAHGLRACWSYPIFDSSGKVLGTFAMYYRHPGRPNARYLHLIKAAAHLAAIAISRSREDAALRESETRLRLATEHSNTALWEWNARSKSIHYSAAWKRQIGYTEDEIGNRFKEWHARLHPDDVGRLDAYLQQVIALRSPRFESEYRLLHKDGTYRWIHSKGALLLDAQGQAERMLGTSQDITPSKLSELRLQRSQALLSNAEKLAGFGSWDRDLVGDDSHWSAGMYSIYGMRQSDGTPRLTAWHDTIHPSDRERVTRYVEQAANESQQFTMEFRIYTHDRAELRHIASRSEAVRDAQGQVVRLWGVDHDISGLVNAQRERAAREGHLRTIIETGPDCVKLLAADGSLLEMNAAGLRMIEADSFEQVAGNLMVSLIAPAHRAAFRQLHNDVFAGAPGKLEFQMCGLKGTSRWLETHASPLLDVDGRVIALLGVTRDVTERRREHVALHDSEERLRLAVDAGRIGIFDWDVPVNRIVWSRWHEALWGFAPGEFAGTYEAFAARVHPDDVDGIARTFERCIAGRTPFVSDFRVVWPDGSVHWIAGSGEFSFAGDGRPLRMRGAVRDITESKLAREALYASRDKLRLLAARMHQVREEQSTSIAREIHDVLAQELTRLKIDVVWAARRLEAPVTERMRVDLATRLQGATLQADTAISAVQKIATVLRPVILDSLGLFAALEWQMEDFARRTDVAARALLPATGHEPVGERATALFRIVQESLTNVARHAQASEVVLQLRMHAGQVELTVRDNGVGITAAQQLDPRSIGLTGMRERAMAFGGSVEFEGVAGGGSAVHVCLPLEDAR